MSGHTIPERIPPPNRNTPFAHSDFGCRSGSGFVFGSHRYGQSLPQRSYNGRNSPLPFAAAGPGLWHAHHNTLGRPCIDQVGDGSCQQVSALEGNGREGCGRRAGRVAHGRPYPYPSHIEPEPTHVGKHTFSQVSGREGYDVGRSMTVRPTHEKVVMVQQSGAEESRTRRDC